MPRDSDEEPAVVPPPPRFVVSTASEEASSTGGVLNIVNTCYNPSSYSSSSCESPVDDTTGNNLPELKIHPLFYPERRNNLQIPRLPTDSSYNLEFQPLDAKDYPCFEIALEYATKGGTFPTVISAVDEVAVQSFLDNKIRYTQIPEILEQVLSAHTNLTNPTLEDIITTEIWATNKAQELVSV